MVRSAQEAVAALRLWKRKASRAAELCAQLPDPLLMIRTLDGIAKPVVDGSHQANFRIATFRMNHNLDVRPSLENLWLFYDLLLAEAEVAVHSTSGIATAADPKTPTRPTVKAMQTPSTGGRTSSSTTTTWPCKFWLTESGCKQGQRCRWPHPWEGVSDKSSRCWNCSSSQHLQQDCPYKAPVKPPVGGDGEGTKDDVTGAGGGRKGKGKGKTKSKDKDSQKGAKEGSNEVKKEEGLPKTAVVGSSETEVKGGGECATVSNGATGGGVCKKPDAGAGGGTNEFLQEATKLLKSLHMPTAKMITLKELANPQCSPSDMMLLDSGATHSLRRASTWEEWEESMQTVVALAQGTTSNLRLKHGTNTLLSTPTDDSFGNGILPMGALARIGYEISWSGSECKVLSPDGQQVEVQIINGCPMLSCQRGMKMMAQLEAHDRAATARTVLVQAIMHQPNLMKELPSLDAATLLTIVLKKEFPDLPDSVCQKIVPHVTEIKGDQLPWNRRMRRRMLRCRRIVLHLFSGKDQKTWRALDDGHTMVVCVDKLLHPKLDVLDDNMFLFLMKLASTGSLQAIIGGPPCRTISSCRYADDDGPKPVRSEQEPYGLASLTSQQREWVEDDIAMFFMKLLYMIAESYKPQWCDKVLFGLEQPQDPKEYRPQAEVEQRQYMSV
eukprot:s1575_g14.t1